MNPGQIHPGQAVEQGRKSEPAVSCSAVHLLRPAGRSEFFSLPSQEVYVTLLLPDSGKMTVLKFWRL
jgi:hypothetical protein